MDYIYDKIYKSIFLTKSLLNIEMLDKIQKNTQRKLANSLPERKSNILKIPEINPETYNFENFRKEYFNKSKPVVIRGMGKNWDCCKKWDFDFFKKNFGNKKIEIKNEKGLNINEETFSTTLDDYLDNYLHDPEKYLSFFTLMDDYPELLKDINLPTLRKLRPKTVKGESFLLFLGGPKSYSPIHSAMSSNIFIMVHGRKHWRIFPKEYFPLLNVKTNEYNHNYSDIDVNAPDTDLYPYFDKIPRYDFTLEAGDILFNPPWLFHTVSNETESIGLRCGAPNFRGNFRISMTQTLVRVSGAYGSLGRSIKNFYQNRDY